MIDFMINNQQDLIFKILSIDSHYYHLNESYEFEIQLLSDVLLNQNIIGTDAHLVIHNRMNIYGYIDHYNSCGVLDDHYCYRIYLKSSLSKLKTIYHDRVFRQQSVNDVIEHILKPISSVHFNYQIILNKGLKQEPSITQYHESDFHFLHRLFSENDLFYCWEQLPNASKLIICDHHISNRNLKLDEVSDKNLMLTKSVIYDVQLQKNHNGIFSFANTNNASIQLGDVIESETFQGRVNGVRYILNDGVHMILQLEIESLQNTLRTPYYYQQSQLGLLSGSVYAPDAQFTDLDDRGCYIVQYDQFSFQQNLSARMARMQLLTGYKFGEHCPLRHQSKVALLFSNGNLDQPAILGLINDAINPNPVTAHNHTQHIYCSYAGHEIIFDDVIHKQFILLQTANHQQLLKCISHQSHSKIILANKTGSMHFICHHHQIEETAQNYEVRVWNQFEIKVSQQYFLKTEKGSIEIIANDFMEFKSTKQQQIEAKNNLMMQASHGMDMEAQNACEITADQTIHFNAFAESLNIQAGQSIFLEADKIEITAGGSSMMIENSVCFNANLIHIIGNEG